MPKKGIWACHLGYHPITFIPVIMKCFESLVMAHIKASITGTLDPLQSSYRSNTSTEDSIPIAIHMARTQLDKRNAYVRMLFIDYSSAFNTIVPSKLVTMLRTLDLDTTLCNWILDFLTADHRL